MEKEEKYDISTPIGLAKRQADERREMHDKHQKEYKNLKDNGDPDRTMNKPETLPDVELNTPLEYKINKLNKSKVE